MKTGSTNNTDITINFTDPLNGSAVAVHFDNYKKMIWSLYGQIIVAATGDNARANYEVKGCVG